MSNRSPIIILGMHRSGTTMIAKHLEQLGIFMGNKKESNAEAVFFLNINNWLLKQLHARWDEPISFQQLERFPKIKKELIDATQKYVFSHRIKKFLGLTRFLKYRNVNNLPAHWGWKDPRNTFTIDIWKKIFPEAKMIHIYRNPVDVAVSLYNREQKYYSNYKSNIFKKAKKHLLAGNLNYIRSFRVTDMDQGIHLWEEYMNQATHVEEKYAGEVCTVKYEDYLESPNKELERITRFLNLDVSPSQLEEICQYVDKNRQYAFLKDSYLKQIYEKYKNGQ